MNRSARVSLGLLDRIIATKEKEVAALRLREAELGDFRNATSADARPGVPGFAAALRAGACVTVIAEVKRRSPSAGLIDGTADPVATAKAYEAGGASAISVLTDAEYFGGSIADLTAVTGAVCLPVIRKDFIIDELQIREARAAGASAVLLIVRLLDAASLRALRTMAEGNGMDALVEVHDEKEIDVALESGACIIGVNNRDLDTLSIDLSVSERLLARIPSSCIAVAESGIRSAADVQRMAAAGADAVLVGEALMRSAASDGTHAGAAAMACIQRVGRA